MFDLNRRKFEGVNNPAEIARNDTKRSFEEICRYMGLFPEYFKNQSTLDLGSGPEQSFAKGLKKLYPESFVVAYDFALGVPNASQSNDSQVYSPEYSANIKPRITSEPGAPVLPVAGLFKELPFKKNSFSRIISYTGFPNYIHSQEEFNQVIGEIGRVLKVGGEFTAYPAIFTKIINPDFHGITTGENYDKVFEDKSIPKEWIYALNNTFQDTLQIYLTEGEKIFIHKFNETNE